MKVKVILEVDPLYATDIALLAWLFDDRAPHKERDFFDEAFLAERLEECLDNWQDMLNVWKDEYARVFPNPGNPN
jgi:hypothetical protein